MTSSYKMYVKILHCYQNWLFTMIFGEILGFLEDKKVDGGGWMSTASLIFSKKLRIQSEFSLISYFLMLPPPIYSTKYFPPKKNLQKNPCHLNFVHCFVKSMKPCIISWNRIHRPGRPCEKWRFCRILSQITLFLETQHRNCSQMNQSSNISLYLLEEFPL